MKALPRWTPAAAAAVAAVLLYLPALGHGWTQDNQVVIRHNVVVHRLEDLGSVLWSPYWPGQLDCWRPLSTLSFAVDWWLWGESTLGYHAQNLLWHAAASALVSLLLLRLRASAPAALLGGVLFALHPLHVEAVANIVGRSDVAAAVFYLLACLLYLNRSVLEPDRVVGVAVLFAAGLGTKEIAITLPAALLLLDFWDRAGEPLAERWRAVLRRGVPMLLSLAAVAAVYLVCRAMVLGSGNVLTYAAPFLAREPASVRLATAARLVPELLRLLLWPADLSVEWGPAVIEVGRWSRPGPYLGLLLVAAGLAWVAARWRERSWISLAIGWVVITYSPISHVLFPVGVMIAERTLYLTSVAVAMIVPALEPALRRWPGRVRVAAAVAAAVVLLAAAVRSTGRIRTWRDDATLLRTMIREHPESFRAVAQRANIAANAGRDEEATRLYEEALALSDYWEPTATDYARFLMARGRADAAERVLRRQIAAHPREGHAYLMLAGALVLQRKWESALDAARTGRRLLDRHLERRAGVDHFASLAFDALGQPDSALARRRAAGEFAPRRGGPGHWMHLARVLHQLGHEEEAREALDQARELAPEWMRPELTLDPPPPVSAYFMVGIGPGPAGRDTVAAAPRAP